MFEHYTDAKQQFGVDAILVEDFVDIRPATWNLICQPSSRQSSFIQYILNQFTNRNHYRMHESLFPGWDLPNKKDVGNLPLLSHFQALARPPSGYTTEQPTSDDMKSLLQDMPLHPSGRPSVFLPMVQICEI